LDFDYWEEIFIKKMKQVTKGEDPAHDFLHFFRVVKMAKKFCSLENAQLEVVLPSAWLHDLVIVPKDDPRRSQASRLSADAAIEYLSHINYPKQYFNQIAHTISAHSFSANIPTESVEAEIIQDADRLDGVGAIGIARCFATAGLLKRSFYSQADPFCQSRLADDKTFTVDHFYNKLFKTVGTLKTDSAKKEGQRRAGVMEAYLKNLSLEIQ
jgi:uncharacterized protein